MSENSKIEWCDHTFNPWEGCTKVSPGCANCYAEARNSRWNGGDSPNWGRGKPRRRTSEANWNKPILWNKRASEFRECSECGWRGPLTSSDWRGCRNSDCMALPESLNPARPRVFCASLADWLDDEVPSHWLVDLVEIIRVTPSIDWLLLTKRPQFFNVQMHRAFQSAEGVRYLRESMIDPIKPESETGAFIKSWIKGGAPENVWVGTSVEDQKRADERIPALMEIPSKVRFLSCEPLLGPVLLPDCNIDWVIVGGESGPGARPMVIDWATLLLDQCKLSRIPFLFKQWGEHDSHGFRMGKKRAGRLLDGRECNEFPEGGGQ